MLIPLFTPPDDEPKRRTVKMLLVAFFVAMGIGLLLLFTRGLMSGPALFIVITSMLALGVAAIVGLANGTSSRRPEKNKHKRGLDGQDIYTLIDRLVDDLDDDERAYLQKRLDEHHSAKNDELAESLGNLLDQRSQDRER